MNIEVPTAGFLAAPGLGAVPAVGGPALPNPGGDVSNGGGGGGERRVIPKETKTEKPKKPKTLLKVAEGKVKDVNSKLGDLRTLQAKINMAGIDVLIPGWYHSKLYFQNFNPYCFENPDVEQINIDQIDVYQLRTDALRQAFSDDLSKHCTAMEAAGFALNQSVLSGEKEEVLAPLVTDASTAIDKFITASKHVKKFLPVPWPYWNLNIFYWICF